MGLAIFILCIGILNLALGFFYGRMSLSNSPVTVTRPQNLPDEPADSLVADEPSAEPEEDDNTLKFPDDWLAVFQKNGETPENAILGIAIWLRHQCDEFITSFHAIDDRSRDFNLGLDAEAPTQLVTDIEAFVKDWTNILDEAEEFLTATDSATDDRAPIDGVLSEHRQRIDATIGTIQALDFESDPFEGVQELIPEVCQLAAHFHDLRDELNAILGVQSTDEVAWDDSPGGQDACMALIDIDHFVGINQQWGLSVADAVISAVIERLVNLLEAGAVAQFRGPSFSIYFKEKALDDCVEAVEQIRESIYEKSFSIDENEIKITVRCAVGAIQDSETKDEVFERLRQALDEGNAVGGNRTVVCAEDGFTLVEPVTAAEQQ